LVAYYLNASEGQKLAAAVYSDSFLLMSLAFFAMQHYLLRSKAHLLHEHLTPEIRRTVLRRNAFGLLPYALATLAAILSPYLTLGICAALAVFYALPSTTTDVQSA
jgi:hypothetical protein